MGRRIRVQTEESIYFVTNRCLQQRFFFRPSPTVNAIILGCLAWAVKKHNITVYAFVFMSNHFHMLLGAPELNLGQFMGEFQSRLATELNNHHERTGYFFEGRYKMEHVVDDEAVIDRLGYILANPVESLLVAHPERWPGVSSWQAHMDQSKVEGRFILKKEFRKLKRDNADLTLDEARKPYAFELEKIPPFEDLEDDEYRDKVEELVEERVESLTTGIDNPEAAFFGSKEVMNQDWRQRPKTIKKSPQPLCHCSDNEKRDAHREWLRDVWDAYKKAMGAFSKWCGTNRRMPRFPAGTYPPGRLRCIGA